MEFKHTSVLLEETIENLNIRPDGVYADGTLGGAGHASEVCKRLSATGRFFGIDQDEAAIKAAGERLAVFGDRVTIIRSNYRDMVRQLQQRGVCGVDGIVLDLGVSSYQLDEADRGFTYRFDAYLHGTAEGSNPYYRRTCGDYQTVHSDESTNERRASGQEDLSGITYRAESGAYGTGRISG